MRTERYLTSPLVAVACAVLATVFLIACQQSQTPAPSSPPPETKPSGIDVYVTFEGPWAIVPDPKDANSVIAVAPKTKSHRPLATVPANTTLEPGVYDLAVPSRAMSAPPTFDKGIFMVKVDPQAVQRALDNRLERYAIRLPKPDAFLAETRYVSRVSSAYPPEPPSEQDWATAVSLRYSVTSKTGFSLAGTQDAGAAFKPILLDVNTPLVRFTIDPAEEHIHDECETHARKAFHDVARLLGLTLFVDFPNSPPDCRKKDPQLAHSEKAELIHGLPAKQFAVFGQVMPEPQQAGISSGFMAMYLDASIRRVASSLAAAIYFFHSDSGGCTAPIIVGNG